LKRRNVKAKGFKKVKSQQKMIKEKRKMTQIKRLLLIWAAFSVAFGLGTEAAWAGGIAIYEMGTPDVPGMGALDYRVGVDVVRYDGNRGGDVALIANWTIREGQGAKVLRVQTSRIQEPSGGRGYETLVGGMSRALGHLSREIAQAIRALPR
jgi:hypothetical protein